MYTSYAIILGGGIGSRMASPIPKQLMTLKGLPVIMHSMKAFYAHRPQTAIILVIHPDFIGQWKKMCSEYKFSIPHHVIEGGDTRFHSVLNGLHFIWQNEEVSEIGDDPVIAIHDGVRPLISAELIEKAYLTAFAHGSAVPAVVSTDSVRLADSKGTSLAIDRSTVRLVQTPQVFRSSILQKAYGQGFDPSFTDDASVVEKSGYPIRIIEGDTRNIKVTYPIDLVIADKLIELD